MPEQVATMPASLHLPTLIVAAALGIAFAGIMLVFGGWRDRAWGAMTLWGSAMIPRGERDDAEKVSGPRLFA